MVLSAIPNFNFLPQNSAVTNFFHSTYLQVAIGGFPASGYRVTLIGLILLLMLALLANAITEKLTSRKLKGIGEASIVTVLGSYLCSAYVLLPFDFSIEGVRIIAALLGAIVIAVFLTLMRAQMAPAKH